MILSAPTEIATLSILSVLALISPLEPYTTALPLLIFPAEAPSNKLISSELDVTPPRIFNSVAEAVTSCPAIWSLATLTSPVVP